MNINSLLQIAFWFGMSFCLYLVFSLAIVWGFNVSPTDEYGKERKWFVVIFTPAALFVGATVYMALIACAITDWPVQKWYRYKFHSIFLVAPDKTADVQKIVDGYLSKKAKNLYSVTYHSIGEGPTFIWSKHVIDDKKGWKQFRYARKVAKKLGYKVKASHQYLLPD